MGRHSFTLQRAEPPKKVRVAEVKPLTNGVEIVVQPPETGGLPLIEYIVKYSSAEKQDDQQQTLTVPGKDAKDSFPTAEKRSVVASTLMIQCAKVAYLY